MNVFEIVLEAERKAARGVEVLIGELEYKIGHYEETVEGGGADASTVAYLEALKVAAAAVKEAKVKILVAAGEAAANVEVEA